MTVATLRVELLIGNCQTVGERRRRMRAIISKLHRNFNVSVADADGDGDPARAFLVAAAVARTRRDVRETLDRVADAVAAYPRAEVIRLDISEI